MPLCPLDHQPEGWCVLITQGSNLNAKSRHFAPGRVPRSMNSERRREPCASYYFIRSSSGVSLSTFNVSKPSKIWDHRLNQINNYNHSHPSPQSRLWRSWIRSASGTGEISAAPTQPDKDSSRLAWARNGATARADFFIHFFISFQSLPRNYWNFSGECSTATGAFTHGLVLHAALTLCINAMELLQGLPPSHEQRGLSCNLPSTSSAFDHPLYRLSKQLSLPINSSLPCSGGWQQRQSSCVCYKPPWLSVWGSLGWTKHPAPRGWIISWDLWNWAGIGNTTELQQWSPRPSLGD